MWQISAFLRKSNMLLRFDKLLLEQENLLAISDKRWPYNIWIITYLNQIAQVIKMKSTDYSNQDYLNGRYILFRRIQQQPAKFYTKPSPWYAGVSLSLAKAELNPIGVCGGGGGVGLACLEVVVLWLYTSSRYWMLQRLYWVSVIIEAFLAPAKAKVRAEARADQCLIHIAIVSAGDQLEVYRCFTWRKPPTKDDQKIFE
jgi:hypothetical protein